MVACAALGCIAAPSGAQVALRLGVVHARYPGVGVLTAGQASLRGQWTNGPDRAAVDLGFASLRGGSWVGQANLESGTTRTYGWGALAQNVAASGALVKGGEPFGQVLGTLAAGRRVGTVVLGVGVAGGGLVPNRSLATWQTAVSASAGIPVGSADGTLRFLRAWSSGQRFAEIDLGLAQRMGPVSLEAGVGARGFDGMRTQATWRVQAAAPFNRFLTMEFAGGASPRSFQGITEGTYLTAGFSISSPRPHAVRPEITRTTTGIRFGIELPRAREVSIAGDWNGWTPVPMVLVESHWIADLPIGQGAHKFMLTVDGKQMVPPGVPKLPDGFGGEVGLLVVN